MRKPWGPTTSFDPGAFNGTPRRPNPTPTAKKKPSTNYPPLSLFRKKPPKHSRPDSDLENRGQPVTDWAGRYDFNEFLSENDGAKPKKPTPVEKAVTTGADIWGKVCAVIAALAVLEVAQKK